VNSDWGMISAKLREEREGQTTGTRTSRLEHRKVDRVLEASRGEVIQQVESSNLKKRLKGQKPSQLRCRCTTKKEGEFDHM
jgi:hypothetical protein